MRGARATILLVILMSTQSYQVSVNSFPRGILLNNPGNIRHSHDKWKGETRLQRDKDFVRFSTPQAGIRAMMKIFLTYENVHHLNSISRIISRWAPPEENNTQAYIDDISIRIGIPQNFFVDLSKPEMLMMLAEAVVMHENGHSHYGLPTYWYEEKIYHDAAIEALQEETE